MSLLFKLLISIYIEKFHYYKRINNNYFVVYRNSCYFIIVLYLIVKHKLLNTVATKRTVRKKRINLKIQLFKILKIKKEIVYSFFFNSVV